MCYEPHIQKAIRTKRRTTDDLPTAASPVQIIIKKDVSNLVYRMRE
jgi:hypothetical protein